MRIEHLGKFYPPEHGGIETATELLSRAGVRLGHSVDCWVARRGFMPRKDEVMSGVQVHRLRTWGRFLSTPITPSLMRQSWRVAADSSTVHLHLPNPVVEIAWLLRSRDGRRVIPYLHALPVSQGTLGKIWFKWITLPILRQSEKILVSSPQFAASMATYGLEEKVRVLPFCASGPAAHEIPRLQEVRRESRLVLALGRLVPYKGFDVLLDAWALLLKRRADLANHRLVIAGSGPEEQALQRKIVELGLSKSVHMRGAVSDVEKIALFREAFLFAAPSTTSAETFGISILEAMCWGLPVLATRLETGMAMLTREGACGAIAQPGDAEDLSLHLEKVLEDRMSAEKLGLGNLEFVQDHFSESRFEESYREILFR